MFMSIFSPLLFSVDEVYSCVLALLPLFQACCRRNHVPSPMFFILRGILCVALFLKKTAVYTFLDSCRWANDRPICTLHLIHSFFCYIIQFLTERPTYFPVRWFAALHAVSKMCRM